MSTETRAPADRGHSRRVRPSGWHLVLAPVAVLFVIPFAQMLLAALSPAEDLVKFPPPFLPSRLTIDGFATLFATTDVLHWLLNSAIVSAIAIIAHVVLCSLAGYGFARLTFGAAVRGSS